MTLPQFNIIACLVGHIEYRVVSGQLDTLLKPQHWLRFRRLRLLWLSKLAKGLKLIFHLLLCCTIMKQMHLTFLPAFPSNHHLQLAFDRSWNDCSLANDSLPSPSPNTPHHSPSFLRSSYQPRSFSISIFLQSRKSRPILIILASNTSILGGREVPVSG